MLEDTLPTLAQTLAQAGNADDENGYTLLIWGVVLIGIAAILFFIEIFVPTGGIVGTASAAALVVGVVLLFGFDTTAGLIGALLALIALPFAISFAVRLWPHTPIGRRLIHRAATDPLDEAYDEPEQRTVEQRPLSRSFEAPEVGARGRAVSELRPVGTCVFEGRRYECLALSGTIHAGTPVQVVAVDGMSIKVKPEQ